MQIVSDSFIWNSALLQKETLLILPYNCKIKHIQQRKADEAAWVELWHYEVSWEAALFVKVNMFMDIVVS